MAESKKIKLSENVTLSFLGNETINEVKLYKYDAKIKNVEKTKTIYLEKEASKYDKTILSDYIIRMVEEYDDQDTFFIVSNNNENNEDKDEVNESTGDGSNSSINDSNNSNDTYGDGGTSNSSSGFSENGGLENSSGTKEQGYSDETVELFQDVAKNAGEFDGSNLDAYKFDLNQFITFKSSIDKLKFISIGELPSAKSSLGQALAKASEGGCDEAVGMIETLIAEVDSKDIASAMDAQVRFYEEVDQIQLQQMQRDAQLNFEDTVASFDSTKYIVSKQEYKDGLKNTLYAAYESLADFMNAVQNYNYQVLSSAGRMAFAESSAGLEFYAMTDAEKEALANGEKGAIDFDKEVLAKLNLNSTEELLGIVGGFKTANELDAYLNSIGDNNVRLAVNEYVNKLIDSRWFNEFSSTEEGKQAYYEYFVNSSKENPNRSAMYDEYDANINTEYINNCIMSGQENLIISELASRPLMLRIINDETGIFGNNISYYTNIDDEEFITYCERYAQENDGNYPTGIRKVDGSLQQKTYTLLGEQFLYEMDYHADEWKKGYDPEKKKYTAFSKQAKYDAEVRSNRCEFIKNYENFDLKGDAERDWAVLNGQIEDKARLKKLKENGCLSFEDSNKIFDIIGASENQDLYNRICELGIDGLNEKDKSTLDTLLKNAGFNENQLWNFKLKYASNDNKNIANYIETQDQSLFDKVSELGYYKLSQEERNTIDEMLKQAGFSNYEITNFKTNANTFLGQKALQTTGASALIAGISFLKGVGKFAENCIDAGITMSNNNFWLLLKDENSSVFAETKKYKEMQQELYNEIMDTYKETGAYDRDYEAFKNSNSFEGDVIDYLVTKGYERDILSLKQTKIDELEEMKKLDPDGSKYFDKEIERVKSEREKLCQEAFLDAKIKELNLGDANASSQMSAAIKLGIRTGDFSKLYEYEKDQQMVDMANNQYSAMLDVAVDNVGDWVQGKIYNKEWYQQVEDASLIKKDNFLGVCVDQIGNMAIPILLSTTIPGVGDMLGASSASMRTLGAIAKVASSTALWTSAFGGAAEEAFNQGANYGDAINYSLLSATTELATEWMFSGIAGIGEGWYDDVLKVAYNKTLGKITSKVIENPKTRAIIEKLVTSGIGEGTEEVVTDLITPLWRSWTLEKELSYNQIRNRDVSFESLFETFSVAFVTSLFFSGMSIRGQHSKLSKNIENISRMAKNNPEFNEVLSNLSSELFAEIIENEGGLSQREIFSEVIGKFREQIMTDSKLKEAMDQANAELLKGIIKTDAANNITNMQEVIESIFDSKLLEQATIDDFATIVNVLNDLSKTSTNITAEQIYQELLDSDSKLFADNFANASKLNETTKGLIKSFTKNTFSYEFEDGSKIELSQSLLSEIAELDQTMKTNSFEINNGELVVKNEKKFRKVIEKAAKNKLTNLKYQNNLLKKEFRKLGKIDANVLENALYFMDQDSSVAHYTNDNVVLEYEGKSINVPVNLAVKIANEIGLDNYIKDGKIVFKSKKEMNAFANKVCELGSKAIDSINKRIDTTPNETFEDALSINNNKINMVANKSTLIVNKTVLEEGVVAYEVIIKNVSENDTGFRRKTIFTTEENLKNVFNENGLVQDIIDLMSQNDESSNIYLELTSKQIENIEKRIGHSQETTDKKTTEIEEKETITQKEQGKTTIQDEVETANQEIDEKANITESVVERSSDNASESTKVKVRARENVEADVRDSSIDVTESVVERNSDNASEPTKVKVRARENVEADVRDSSIDVTESVVERNDSSTREATRVKVRTRENTSTNIDEPAKASERVDAAQRNNATQTNADVIRNAASAATVVINAVANNANKASIVVDAPVYERKISNAETHGTQTIPNTQNDTNNIESTSNEEFSEVREVSKESVRETAERDGYIAYKDNEAAKLFEQNPEYKDWKHEVVDGEHRFYPPEKKQTSEVAQIIEQSNIEDIQTDFDSNDNMEIKNSNINTAIETPNSSKSSSSAVDSITIPNTVDLSQVHTSEELVDALFETNTLEANETRDKEFIAWKLQAIKDGTTMPDSYDERSGIMGGQPLSETYFDSSNERINAGKTHYLSAEEKGYRANFDYRVTIKNSSKLNYEDATAFTKTLFEELEKRGVGFAYKNHWESDAIILYVDENQLLDTVKVLEDLKDGTKYGQSVVNAINNFGLPISFGATISSNPYYGISMAHGEGRYGVVSKIKTSWGNVGEGATFNVYTQSVLFKNAYDNLLSKYNGNVDAITVDEMYDEILKLHREYMFGKGSTENIPLWMNRRNYIDYKKHKEAIAYKSSESVLTQTSENVAEATMRNSQTVLETNSDIEVIKVKNAKPSITQKFKRGFDPSLSYEGFDYVVKPKTSFEQALNEIIANNNGSNIVIEINNTTELTLDLIEQIPDNVKVRVTGDYNVDFMNAFKSAQQSGNGTLRNVTYTKEQLKSIMTEIIEFEKGIDPNWSDMEKARYAYDYLKNNIKYHDVKQIHELSSKEGMVGNNADRLARYDGLVSLIEKSSTCQGFAATYQELLTRMGIDARIVPGNLNGEGQHVYNVVKIDGKTFIVDSVREMLEANSPGKYTGSGFNVENIFEYRTKSSYQELIKESVLTQISENIDEIVKKGVYNNMSLEELSDFIKENYSETQIPNNLKEFIHQIDEIRMDKAANEVEVEDIHIDEYVDGINEEQESAVEVLTKAKEDLKKLRGGAAGIVSKFLKANAVALTTIANPSLGIGSTITYNMVAQQILNGEFVANNRATEIMKETTLKILTWGYGKEQRMQIRNQIEYVEQVRAELLEQGIDLKVSRSKKIQNIISEKVKVVKENIKNVYGNVKARFNNNVKTNGIVVNESSMSNEIVNNRNSRINELIDMSRNGTDIHYEYRTSSDTSLKEVQNEIVNMYENNSKVFVHDSGSWTYIHIGTDPNTTLDNAIKIYVPIDGTNANVVTKQVLDFLLENNIASRNIVGSHVKGDAFVLRIFDKTDAKRVINFINEQVKLNPLTGKEIPLTFKAGGVSVAMDGLTSYNQIATILIDNFAKNNLGTDINGFKEFVHALNEQIINGDVDLFETMFKEQIKNVEENPYADNEQLAKANIYEVIDIIDKALNNNMNANEFVDYISEYQNTSKVNDVIKRITGTEVINQNRVVKPNIVKTFITNINEKFSVVRNNIGEKFRIAKGKVNQFKVDLKEKLEIRHAENSHISADTSNVRIERIKLQMNSLMETYNGKVDFIREAVIKTLEYKNIPVTEENIRTNLEQVLNGNYNVITSREGLRQQVINASNEMNYCVNELSRLSLEISANEMGSVVMNAGDIKLDNIIKNANEMGSKVYRNYVEMHPEDRFDDVWHNIEGYFEQNSYDNLVVERWPNGNFLNFTIGKPKSSPLSNSIKMYIPINHANASYVVKTIIEQLAKNNIASDNKIARIARDDAFVLRIYDVNDAYRVANWINNNFNLEATGSELPLSYKFGKIRIAMDGRTSYNSIVTQLIQYYTKNNVQNLDLNGFKDFVRNLKRDVILNKNTDILETIFAGNTFENLKNRYIMEYKYDKNYAKANAYANLYEIIDILDANLNGNMSTMDFFRYLDEYTKPAKVGNIIATLSTDSINVDATISQTSFESVVTNNNQATIIDAAKLIANNNENLFAALRYKEMDGYQLQDLLVQVLGMKQEGSLTVSNEMQVLLDEFETNNGVITDEMLESSKQALLSIQNQSANNFELGLGSILENMGYERVMEKFGISEEAILNDLSQLYNDLFKTYEKFGLTEEQLNMIFAKIKFRNLDEMRRIYHKSDVDVIGGINIAGTSYVNLDSKMNTKYEIFLENVYHECTHAIGRITQNEINGYKIKGIINEYFTDLQAKKAGGFLKSEAYIPKLVNILEIIEKTLDPSCELFTKVYVEGNFSSLIDRLIEITGNENLANKLAKEIVETIETTHYNILNVMESNQVIMKNYYLQQAESFVEYLKQQIDSVNIENSDENIKQNTVSQEKIDNIEEIEISDEIVGSIEHVHKISIFDKIKEKITIVKNDIKNVYGNVRAKLQSVLKTKTNNGIAKSNNQDIEIIDESTIGKYKYKKGQIFGKKLPVPDDIIKHVYNKDLSLRYFLEYELYDKIPISCLTNEARRVVEEFGIEKLKQIDVEFLKLISNSFDSYHLDDYEYFDDKIYWMKYSASVEDINEKLYDSFKWLIHPSQLPDKVKQIYKDSLFYSPEELERIGHLGDDYEGVPRITEQEGPMIEDLIRGWDVYKDKDLNYFLNKLEWFRNKYREDASYKFKKFMNEYRTFVEELIQDRGLSSDQIYDVVTDTMTYFPFSPLNRIYKRDNLIFLGLNVEKVQWFADCFGLDNIIEFDNENGHILIKNDFEMLKLMYESERAKERMKNVMYDTWYYHGGSRGEFYDFLKETILDGNFSPDYREITGEFRDRLADLFISEQAPTELQDLFYSNSIATSQLLQEHPEYIQYLKNMKLEVIYKNYLVSINGSKTNLASVIEQTFGEEGLNLMIEYGKYIDAANQKILLYEMHRNGSSFTKEELLDELDSFILEGIGAGMTYDENMPSHFKEKYPTLFLKQGISENIKNKFYSRQFTFTIEDFTKNPELFELFENTSVICGLDQEYSWLIPLVNDFDNYNQLRFAQQYYRISNKRMGKVYKEYVKGHINDIDVTNIENIGEVLYRLATSNSSEINRLMEGLATRILNTPKPLETLDKVEDVFVRNNIPTVGKLYSCFETFCPDFRGFSFSEDSTISPMLKKSSLIQKKFITFSDLIKAAFGSNNRSVNSYLKNIEIGYKLYRRIKSEELSYDSLSEIEKKELVTFAKHLSTLYDNTLKGKSGNSEFISTGNIIEDISELSIKLSPNGTLDYNLADRIVKMFCGFSRIDTLEKAKSYISTKIETADARNRETASKKILLEEGDLIKGVIDGLKYLGNILQNGLTSKEYVGAGGTTDYTPLDIDVSMVKSIEGTIGDKINRSSAKPYGPIWFILKNDERFITTRDISGEIGTLRDTSKLELFYTGYTAEDHYGVRTGFASSEINYMVMEHYDPRVGLEIAMNGFYIPVVNFNGEVVFKPEDYDTLREKMAGLSYYDENNYEFSSNLITEDTNSIVPKLEQSNEEIHAKKAKIDAFLSKILGDYGLRMKTKIDGVLDTGSVELIDTGSTGRGTNKPSDGDFDFVMRLDKSILFDSEKLEDFTGWLNDSMVADDKIITDGGDFRFKGVQIDESLKVDLDISFVGKTDKITYSTDMALLDRLSTIKNIDQERYNYVVANIIFAKQFLKQAECYKPYRSDAEQGGLGGVGVENWILQNGGSFIDAAKEFLENSRLISYSDYLRDNPNRTFKSYLKATKSIKFEDFSKKYQIWDYGENHFAAKRQEADEQKKKKQKEKEYYFHDNFVKGNMSEAGYEKMVEALEKYISKINISNADATAHRQQFYGEAIETPTKSLSHYERLLDDLKIGKKSLFEKVDTAIYRDLSTMKSYIARSEVSNAEAKFLTEKTFLRLAEKYWGNEDAMKILSDIVPREGETLRETIASISNRVCELELSMYEENAAINEIHYVLDIPVKIIGNSSPILYLRLNEFEKAISRMPEKLKSILKTVDIKIYDTECFENATSSIDYDDSPKKRFVIYAGTMDNELRFYEHGASSLTGIPSIEYETITHELGHIIDNRLGNSEMRYTEMSDEWKRAMKADKLISNKDSVSDYGKTKVEEDFAESIKLYYRSAGFLKKNFPNRARLVEKCINNMNVHSPTMNAKTQNFYRSDTALNTKDVNNLISSKNIELSDIANLDSTKPISKIKDELFETIKSLDTPIDSEVIDRLTYLLDTYKTSNGSIYYKDVIGNDTYIITDNNVLFRLDNNENSILDVVDYLSNMSNSERNNMFLSFYKDTARIVNSYDSDNINRIHRVLSRLFSSDTYYEHKTKYIDLYSDNNYGSKQDIIPYYLKDSSLKERLVKLVKSIYPGMDDINANRLLRHMEVTPITDEGMCSYSVIANMIYEKYYGNSEAFLRDFSYEMSINSRLNSGELMADMYAYCNRGVLVNDNIVSTTNEEQVSLCDRKVSSMWNKLFNTDLINSFFKSKNINLEVSEEVLFDYYNIDGNTNPLSKNLFDGIISNIVKSLEQGKHVAIALSDFDIVVDGFEERISNNHVMSIVSVLDNGLLEVDSWGKKCYIDLKNITKSARQITISELSLNEK